MNELAGLCLPSQKFGANAAWLRMNVLLYDPLSACPRHARCSPIRQHFLVLDTVGKVVGRPREPLLGCADALARALAHAPRIVFQLLRPIPAGE